LNGVSRRFPIALFSFFAALYLLTFRGVSVGDDVYHYEFVKSILQRHQFSLPQNDPLLQTDREFSPFFAVGRDDRPYLTLPPGLSIASLPLGALGFLVESIAGCDTLEADPKDDEQRIDITTAIGEIRSTPSAFMAGLMRIPVNSATHSD
jgi:hypothetical protein